MNQFVRVRVPFLRVRVVNASDTKLQLQFQKFFKSKLIAEPIKGSKLCLQCRLSSTEL